METFVLLAVVILLLYDAGITLVSVFQTVFRRTLGFGEKNLDDSENFSCWRTDGLVVYFDAAQPTVLYPRERNLTCTAWVQSLNL